MPSICEGPPVTATICLPEGSRYSGATWCRPDPRAARAAPGASPPRTPPGSARRGCCGAPRSCHLGPESLVEQIDLGRLEGRGVEHVGHLVAVELAALHERVRDARD